MNTEPELLNERLERLAMVLDEIMPNCALLVRDALELLKEQEEELYKLDRENQLMLERMAEQPEIVRCKDCKWRSYYCTEAIDGTTMYTCHYPCANDVPRPADWFCADGERKDSTK